MAKFGFVMDVSKCVACYACFVACKDEYWEKRLSPRIGSSAQTGAVLDEHKQKGAWQAPIHQGCLYAGSLYAL